MLKKILYLTLLFAFVVSFSSVQSQIVKEKSGGYARIQSMGANPYLIDPFMMTLNPAWGAEYDNFIFGDLGSTQTAFGNDGAGQFIGANFRVSPLLTVGALLTRNDFNGQFSIANLDPGGIVSMLNGVTELNNNIELMATYKKGIHKFGFGLAFAGTTNDFNPASGNKSEASASQIGFNLGYLGKMAPGLLLDVGVSLSFPSASTTASDGSKSSVSQTNLGLNARAFYDLSPKFKVVPAFTFVTATGSGEVASNKSDLPSTSIIILGAGLTYESGDFLFAGGPSFVSLSTTQPSVDGTTPELTSSTTLFPAWNIGAEWGMLDWLYARFGYISITGSISTESVATSTSVNERVSTLYGPTGAFIGLGLKLGNLSLDGTVNSDVLRQGLNNLAGGGATFGYLSLSIYFD
jgi:hypothetical protein